MGVSSYTSAPLRRGFFSGRANAPAETSVTNALGHCDARSKRRASMILYWCAPRFALALRLLGACQPGLRNLKQRSAVRLVCRGLRQSLAFLGVFPELGGALHAHPRICCQTRGANRQGMAKVPIAEPCFLRNQGGPKALRASYFLPSVLIRWSRLAASSASRIQQSAMASNSALSRGFCTF